MGRTGCLAIVLFSLASGGARGEEAATGTLILDGSLVGRVAVIDPRTAVFVADREKAAGEVVRLMVAAGEYRVALSGGDEELLGWAVVRVVVGSETSVGLADLVVEEGGETGAAATVEPAEPEPLPPRLRYPRGLAARPLTLPGSLVEAGVAYFGTFSSSSYGHDFELIGRWAITDRIEIRQLGVYGALVRAKVPEIGGGVALTGLGYSSVEGLILAFTVWLDFKLHLGARVALWPRGAYTLRLATGHAATPDHDLTVGMDLLVDVAKIVSLIVSGAYRQLRSPSGVDDEVALAGAVHVAALSWLDLQLGLGPVWLRAGSSPFSLHARWTAAVRFHW
ncbi:MAG: hypothetical protein EXR72_11680 [Myxococcales bacterium]|nr:hypothetical protein [Myxococcales bacterium]